MKLGQKCFYRCNECKKVEEGFDHEVPEGWRCVATREWLPDSASDTHFCKECRRRQERYRRSKEEGYPF